MSDPKLPDYLEHIRQAATDACGFVTGLSQDEFIADRRTQLAVIMSLVIIGEAATRLMDRYPEFVEPHPDIPWQSMRGMRNRIAHGYFDLQADIVWRTVQTDLPQLLARLAALQGGNDGRSGSPR
ncbi:MAG TPA: DUF86 domain-containing protein [Ramlibacter sp.]|uniref:HepT-like ribonuclease domain-containing protein n=1 Tax=Ramlibacter sp. TaxID=1917967 RepID=UPI002D7F62A7|nr:DUF86 domain-containing protein [Ramlibacter sp.]HET8744891.1 DUF86 domain-containing protein [Ramlibacter sp.]